MNRQVEKIDAQLARVDSWIARHRHAVGPVLVALAVTAVAAGAHRLWERLGWETGRWLVLVAAAVVWLLAWPSVLDLPRGRERWYGATGFAVGCGYAAAVAWWGPTHLLLGLGATATVGLGIPWYYHRRVRRGVQVDRTIAAWGDGSAVGLHGTELVESAGRAGRDWWEAPIRALRPGQWTKAQFRAARERIAALYGVPVDQVEIGDGGHEGEALLRVRTTATPSHVEPFPLPTRRVDVRGPKEVGRYTDGSAAHVVLNAQGVGGYDGVALGVKGSGKSSWGELVAEHTLAATNAVLFIIDLKPGAQHWRRWAPACACFVDSPEKLDLVFRALSGLMKHRGAHSTGSIHTPTPDSPHVTVLFDESALAFSRQLAVVSGADLGQAQAARAQVVTQRVALMEDSIRVTRSFGIGTFMMSQYGVNDAFASGAVLAELTAGNCAIFRVAKYQDASLVSPRLPMDPSKFSKALPGQVYLNTPASDREESSRCHKRTDAEIDQLVARFPADAPDAPRFNPGEVAAMRDAIGAAAFAELFPLYADTPASPAAGVPHPGGPTPGTGGPVGDGERFVPDFSLTASPTAPPAGSPAPSPTPRGGSPAAIPHASPAPRPPQVTAGSPTPEPVGDERRRLSPEESRALVLETLRSLPDGRGTVEQVAAACGRSQQIVRVRLRELADEGLTRSKGRREPVWTAL